MAIDGAVSAIVVWSRATAVWPPLSAWAACPSKSEAKARAIETTKNLGLRMIGTAFPLGVARRVHPGSQHPLMQTHVRQLPQHVCVEPKDKDCVMSKRARKRRLRKGNKANHGRKPNA